jgi:GDPmannose 4,6-dehydratase
MWMMPQSSTAADCIPTTGAFHTAREFVELAFRTAGLDWHDYGKHDQILVMTAEPTAPCGNPARARRLLGWENTAPFTELGARFFDSELAKCG